MADDATLASLLGEENVKNITIVSGERGAEKLREMLNQTRDIDGHIEVQKQLLENFYAATRNNLRAATTPEQQQEILKAAHALDGPVEPGKKGPAESGVDNFLQHLKEARQIPATDLGAQRALVEKGKDDLTSYGARIVDIRSAIVHPPKVLTPEQIAEQQNAVKLMNDGAAQLKPLQDKIVDAVQKATKAEEAAVQNRNNPDIMKALQDAMRDATNDPSEANKAKYAAVMKQYVEQAQTGAKKAAENTVGQETTVTGDQMNHAIQRLNEATKPFFKQDPNQKPLGVAGVKDPTQRSELVDNPYQAVIDACSAGNLIVTRDDKGTPVITRITQIAEGTKIDTFNIANANDTPDKSTTSQQELRDACSGVAAQANLRQDASKGPAK